MDETTEQNKIQIQYFQLYASDFLMYKNLLTNDELIEVIEGISIYCLFNKKKEFENEYQKAFYDKLINSSDKNKQNYLIKIQNGKKGGRPPKNLNKTETKPIGYEQVNLNETETKPKRNQYNRIEENIIEENIIKEENKIENNNKYNNCFNSDLLFDKNINKVFDLYKDLCKDLVPIKFEKRNREYLSLIKDFLIQIQLDFEYVKELFIKANNQKIFYKNKLMLMSIIKNHDKIYAGLGADEDINVPSKNELTFKEKMEQYRIEAERRENEQNRMDK